MSYFITGAIVGTIFGVILMCCCITSKENDKYIEGYNDGVIDTDIEKYRS